MPGVGSDLDSCARRTPRKNQDLTPLAPATRVLFVTGKLAEPALRRVLSETDLPFSAEVAVMRITVAALMTTDWIARFLDVPSGMDLVMIPGLCEGDVGAVAAKAGVRVEKEIRRLLRAQRDQQAGEQRVLEHVGEVAGVEVMSI